MKGIAIGFSDASKEILKRLKKTEFINEIYIGSSSQIDKKIKDSIECLKPKLILKKKWKELELIIFVGSVGASIRLINSLLSSKDKDPGIIVIDKKGSKIIPLIGAHQSNVQNIAFQICNLFGGEIIETNNSIEENYLNIDSFGYQWGWKRSGDTKDWSKLVIKQANNKEIFCSQSSGNDLWKTSDSGKNITQISEKDNEPNKASFNISIFSNHKNTWHPAMLWIGLGCERNTSKQLIEDSIQKFLATNNLSPLSIAGYATIDIKKDEQAFLKISRENKLPIKFFRAELLSTINVPNPSNIVLNEIGTPSVAEAACILAAGEGAKLLGEKKIFKNIDLSKSKFGAVTIAVARSKNQYYPLTGEIHVVGIGPGDISYLTNDARKALSKCSIWIGYKMYLDLIKPLKRKDQVIIESNLTEERERCEKAIKLSEEGIKVALISSGDAGVYGMAGLLLELIQTMKKELRPSFEIHPGISSMQLAAALGGAPLMNDFCSISLSDKLTPWESIEKRIEGALLGDFVITIFNPQSIERNWQLKRAIKLVLGHRPGNTPVLVGRQVGRKNQSKRFFSLDSIPLEEIDMLSIIIIGNSKTTLVDDIFLTPRGYL
ncbi:bifunctional cbiH protein and precorrin-3B C17-methyltransferase [Prochlorococcus marinus str. MIT 9515]|uniref:Bifunctional cbiH protein and precorrin-3B C17-methyltransferase n=1 Tax=Prochlorococcus marinus (strain MIT 9515) TaxID=167542 RepID=A2BYQ0_PROM5|nr:precorrin-3B C(17)-methyltransferase [Prochlorococcus marinus]ABM72911.1 bifunctional cbiH protein and precorrin-3B C17-methyltransferase [Prochlorococcus marinus str. MIT 9515]